MKTLRYLHLAEFFLEWEMFQTNAVEKNQITHFVFNKMFFPEKYNVD